MSMNWAEVATSIHKTLDDKGLHDVSFEIGQEQLKGGTGGEIFSLLVGKLISIREERPEVYALIKEETEWLIAYGRTINYWR